MIKVASDVVALFGDEATLRERVEAFRKALREHAFTENVPAPVEADVVEKLARAEVDFEVVGIDRTGQEIPKGEVDALRDRVAQLEALVAKLVKE